MAPLLLLLACSTPLDDAGPGRDPDPGTDPVDDPDTTDDDPVTWEGIPDDEPLPQLLDAEAVGRQIHLGFERLLALDADTLDANINNTWDGIASSTGCPESYGYSSGADYTYEDWWSGGCEDPNGLQLSGYGQRSTSRYSDGGSTSTTVAGYFEGTATSPEGYEAGGFGYYYLEDGRDSETTWVYHYFIGEMKGEAADTAGSWLESTAGYAYSGYAGWDRWGGLWMGISGNVPLDGEAVAFAVVDMEGYSTSWGYPCPGEYVGTWQVRDANGWWYILEFDADAYDKPAGTCDGCGDVTVDGVSIGSACPDLEPLVNVEAIAW